MRPEDAAAAYAAFFESLTPARLGELEALCAPSVRFRDPFNEVHGVAAFRAVLATMFADLEAPRFAVGDRACSGRVCYLRWSFTARTRGRPLSIEGMSEVHFDASGRVLAHVDHWDAASQLYERLPLLGPVLRLVRRRLAAPV